MTSRKEVTIMERSDEYRALRQELLKMSREGFCSRRDITRLKDILKRIAQISDDDVALLAMRLSFLLPRLRKQYVNFDDGDIAFLEEDWDYDEIKKNLDLFVKRMYHGLKIM